MFSWQLNSWYSNNIMNAKIVLWQVLTGTVSSRKNIQMEGSHLYAGTYLVTYICSHFLTLGPFLPQSSNLPCCSHGSSSTPLCFLPDSPRLDHIQLPLLLLSRRCRRCHAKKLFKAAAQNDKNHRRRYRRYHHHYHRRVKFLYNRQKPCPKLPTPITRQSISFIIFKDWSVANHLISKNAYIIISSPKPIMRMRPSFSHMIRNVYLLRISHHWT